jgi:hypothetical protein
VAHASLLTDELLRHFMAVGQVDLVVGLPTLNNAGTIGAAIQAADDGLGKVYSRDRTVIIVADGGSGDGTVETVRQIFTSGGRGRGGPGLRTRHRICAPYPGVPGRAGALRLTFAAAELLQARTVVVLDTDVTSLTPNWVSSLAGPIATQSFDFIAPLYDRHPLEGPLLSQLVRPVIQATYGRRVHEPLIGEFACSGRFAAHCLSQDIWADGTLQGGIEVWLTGTACASEFRAGETYLGPRTLAPSQPARPALREVFPAIVGALFESLVRHAPDWLARTGSEVLPSLGPDGRAPMEAPSMNAARLGESFGRDVRDLWPVLESILAPDTCAAVGAIAEAAGSEPPDYPDALWITTVYDYLGAYRAGAIDKRHIVQALIPLYLGRVGAFLTRHAASTSSEVEQALEQLSEQFEGAKPYLTERWNRTT